MITGYIILLLLAHAGVDALSPTRELKTHGSSLPQLDDRVEQPQSALDGLRNDSSTNEVKDQPISVSNAYPSPVDSHLAETDRTLPTLVVTLQTQVTHAPRLRKRNAFPEPIPQADFSAQLSQASADASRSASQAIQQATQSAQQSIDAASQTVSQVQQSASQAVQQASKSAADAVSSANSQLSSIQASASQAVASASSAQVRPKIPPQLNQSDVSNLMTGLCVKGYRSCYR
jgi:hypothetical protein